MYTIKELLLPFVRDMQNLRVGPFLARFSVNSIKALRDLLETPIQIRYKGLVCFGERSGFAEAGSADEPLVFIATITQDVARADRFPHPEVSYKDVDSGDSRNSPIAPTFTGLPAAVGMYIELWDFAGDLTESAGREHAEHMRLNMRLSANYGRRLTADDGGYIPEDCERKLETFGGLATVPYSHIFGDPIGHAYMVIPVEELVRIPAEPLRSFKAIDYHRESPLLTDGDASYKVYFDVVLGQ